jgi:hypothetical protein
MSEIPGRHLLAPKSEGGHLGKGSPNVAKSEHQKQNRSVSVEKQACFFVLLPIALSVVLLAIAGSPR